MKEIKVGFPLEDKDLVIQEFSITYSQNNDSNQESGIQQLKLSISDAGGGHYYVLETERWAIDDIDELIKLLNDFKKRLE